MLRTASRSSSGSSRKGLHAARLTAQLKRTVTCRLSESGPPQFASVQDFYRLVPEVA